MSASQVDIDNETIQFDGRWLSKEDLARTIRGMLDGGNYNVARPSAALEQLNAALADVRTVAFRASPELSESIAEAAQKADRTPGALIREAVGQYLAALKAGTAPSMTEPKKAEPEGRRPTYPELPAVGSEQGLTIRMPVPTAEQIAQFKQQQAQATPPPSSPPPSSVPQSSAPPAEPDAAPEPQTAQAEAPPAADAAPQAPAPQLAAEPRTPTAPPPGLKPHAPVAGPGALRAAGVPSSPAPSVVVDQALAGAAQVVTEAAAPEDAADAVELTPKPKDGEAQDAVERRWFGG